jgi:hypothetical protein
MKKLFLAVGLIINLMEGAKKIGEEITEVLEYTPASCM